MGMIVRTLALATKVIAGQAETADNSERKSISTDDLTKAIKTIDQKIYYPYGHYHPVIRALLASVKLLTALAATGECRRSVPFAPMTKVGKADGTAVWRCSHHPAHEF